MHALAKKLLPQAGSPGWMSVCPLRVANTALAIDLCIQVPRP